jgi:acetyl esterase/lipase
MQTHPLARPITLLSAAISAGTLLILVQAASAADPVPNVVLEEKIIYGKAGTEDLKLDLARPEHPTDLLPGIIYIHGGGWEGGSRQEFRSEIQEAAKRGYVAITIDYRLNKVDKEGKPKYPFPAQLEDAKCAVRWLRANAEKYHLDAQHIGATGTSAGGHLSLMLAVTGADKQFEGTGGNPGVSSQVQAVVNHFGPTDFAKMYGYNKMVDKIFDRFLGGTPQQRPEQYKAGSPVSYVSKDACPILTIHGTVDKLVPVDQAVEFDAAMKNAGGTSKLMILDNEGHGFRGPERLKARDATLVFFDAYLKHAR